jgi:hypothetical protein
MNDKKYPTKDILIILLIWVITLSFVYLVYLKIKLFTK